MEDKSLLSVWEVMKKLSIGRDSAYTLMKSNQFHTVKIGRRYYVSPEVLNNWINGTKIKS